jgi:carboxyl-terminal processing protease
MLIVSLRVQRASKGLGDMGKILFIALAIFVSAVATAKTFEVKSRNVEIYSAAVSRISTEHVLQIPMDKNLFLRALEVYANKLDLYKIVFNKQDLVALATTLPQDGSDTQREVEIIYEIYNLYIAKLKALQSVLPLLKPSKPQVSHLPDDIAASPNDLKQSQNDFVFDRYLRAEIAGSPKSGIPTLIQQLLRVEIENAEMQTLSQPLTHYLNSLGESLDPHTFFKSNDEAEQADTGLMGITFEQAEGYIQIISVYSGSSAEKSGIRAGDKLLAYAHEPNSELIYTSTLSSEEFGRIAAAPVKHISSVLVQKPDGQIVSLQLARSAPEDLTGLGLPLLLPETEDMASQPKKEPTKIPVLENNRVVKLYFANAKGDQKVYPVIRISSFMYDADNKELSIATEMLNVLKTLEIIWADKTVIQRQIILDMKNNQGGIAKQAVTLAQIFLDKPIYIQTIETGGGELPFYPEPGYDGHATSIPMVVWVNEECASACEMFASIMQDTGRALIVGSNTNGKGVGQLQDEINFPSLDFSFGLDDILNGAEELPPTLAGNLAVTVFTYYRLNGDSIQIQGLTPDVKIASGNEFSSIGMRYTKNPIPHSKIPATHPDLLQSIDISLVSKLQTASVERWSTNIYSEYILAHQNLAKALASTDDTSFDLRARRAYTANVLQAQQLVNLKKEDVSKVDYPFNLYDIDKNPQISKVNQAGLQEFMNVSVDYFSQTF